MTVEIITTGSELLLGQIVDANAAYLAAALNEIGYDVIYQTTVGDNRERMAAVLRHALNRVEIVVTTGGLGPTRGDITKEVTAAVCGVGMYRDEPTVKRLEKHFAKVGRPMTENNLRQAMIPIGAVVLANHAGTAPGVVLADKTTGRFIANLPGPPHECRAMWENALKPYLVERFGQKAAIVSRVINTYGIGESLLETKIDDLVLRQKNPTIALLARPTGTIIRLTAKAPDGMAAEAMIEPLAAEIKKRLAAYVYAENDEPIEKIIGEKLQERGATLATAESCTGGLIAGRLTKIPGSSRYFKGGIVSYTNEAKINCLSVAEDTIGEKTAVSKETAELMAKGAAEKLDADYAVAVTGLAGPDGDGTNRPVGLVYIAVAKKGGATRVQEFHFRGDRERIRSAAGQSALFMLFETLRHQE